MGRLVFLVVLGCLTIGLGFFWLVSRWRESAHTAVIGAVLVGVGVVVAGLATSGLRKLSPGSATANEIADVVDPLHDDDSD